LKDLEGSSSDPPKENRTCTFKNTTMMTKKKLMRKKEVFTLLSSGMAKQSERRYRRSAIPSMAKDTIYQSKKR
jgi:hypothetical protein